jgi:hypothetical protein
MLNIRVGDTEVLYRECFCIQECFYMSCRVRQEAPFLSYISIVYVPLLPALSISEKAWMQCCCSSQSCM